MFFNVEAYFIEKIIWESGFSNFSHVTFFAKQKCGVFLAAILKYDMYGVFGFIHMWCKFRPKFLREWMSQSRPPSPKREWKVA